jgi:hypothetical protein
MVNHQVGRFSNVLQVDYQRKGSMANGQVDSFGKVLCALRGKRRSSIEFRSTVEISLDFEIEQIKRLL